MGRLLGLIALLLPSVAVAADPPWMEPFADPAEVLRAAEEATAGQSTGEVLLYSSMAYSFDEEGRMTWTSRVVSRYLDRETVDNDRGLGTQWSPWRQSRPQIRVRVILADGTAHELDPSLLVEGTVGRTGDAIYDDTKTLQGPIANLAPGAIVESSFTVAETRPLSEAGRVLQAGLWASDTAETQVLAVSAPTSLKLTTKPRDLPDNHRKIVQVKDGRRTMTWVLPPQDPLREYERNVPRDPIPGPVVEISTAKSWQAVAADYGAAVDAVLASEDLASLADEAVGDAKKREEIVERAFDWVVTNVRYTGLEFGRQALIPVAPSTTLERGFGDCKDQATLMVGILRERGLDAHVALLNVGEYYDVPDIPGLGLFDHAIVHVGGGESIWADPTVRHSRPGVLPDADQGRLALVAGPKTRRLSLIPVADAADARWWEDTTYDIPVEDRATVLHRFGAHGHLESELRSGYTGNVSGSEDVLEWAQGWAEDKFGATGVTSFDFTDPDDPTTPFAIEATVTASHFAADGAEEAVGIVNAADLLIEVTSIYQERIPEDEPREGEVTLLRQHTTDIVRRFVFPPGYLITELPEASTGSVGPASWSIDFAESDPRGDRPVATATMQLVFDAQGRDRMTAAEFTELTGALADLNDSDYLWIRAMHRSEKLRLDGKTEEALAVLRTEAAADPSDPMPLLRAGWLLAEAGLGEAGQALAKKATEAAPDMERAWLVYAYTLTLDALGREFKGGWKRDETIEAYRRALAIAPDTPESKQALASALEHDADGVRWSVHSDLAEAAKLLEGIRHEDVPDARTMHWVDLFRLHRFDDLEALIKDEDDKAANLLMVSLRAISGGSDAAMGEARRRSTGLAAAKQMLAGAYTDLVGNRQYKAARDVLLALGAGAPPPPTQAAIDLLERVIEGPERDRSTAVGGALTAFEVIMRGPDGPVAPADVFAPAALSVMDPAAYTAGARAALIGSAELSKLAFPPRASIDIAMGGLEAEEVEVGKGLSIVYVGAKGTKKMGFLVQRERGKWWVSSLGVEALQMGAELTARLEGNKKRALQYAEAIVQFSRGRSAETMELAVVRGLWPEAPTEVEEVERLAAFLRCVEPAECADAITTVVGADLAEQSGAVILYLMERQAEAGRWADLAELNGRVRMEGSDAPAPWTDAEADHRRVEMAFPSIQSGDEAMIAAAVEGLADDLPGLERRRMWLDVALGDVEGVDRRTRALLEGEENASRLNDLAWARLVVGLNDDVTLEAAQAAASKENGQKHAILHTLATAYAQMGMGQEARTMLETATSKASTDELSSSDWYVVGRIAEIYGAPEAARAAYERVEPDPLFGYMSVYPMAQRRLAQLPD